MTDFPGESVTAIEAFGALLEQVTPEILAALGHIAGEGGWSDQAQEWTNRLADACDVAFGGLQIIYDAINETPTPPVVEEMPTEHSEAAEPADSTLAPSILFDSEALAGLSDLAISVLHFSLDHPGATLLEMRDSIPGLEGLPSKTVIKIRKEIIDHLAAKGINAFWDGEGSTKARAHTLVIVPESPPLAEPHDPVNEPVAEVPAAAVVSLDPPPVQIPAALPSERQTTAQFRPPSQAVKPATADHSPTEDANYPPIESIDMDPFFVRHGDFHVGTFVREVLGVSRLLPRDFSLLVDRLKQAQEEGKIIHRGGGQYTSKIYDPAAAETSREQPAAPADNDAAFEAMLKSAGVRAQNTGFKPRQRGRGWRNY